MRSEFTWRPVGFREVWALLDLDRYDEILLEDMHKTDERMRTGFIELFQRDRKDITKPSLVADHPSPISNNTNTGKSLGVMRVEDVKAKFL